MPRFVTTRPIVPWLWMTLLISCRCPEQPAPAESESTAEARYGAWETVEPEKGGGAIGKVLGMQAVHAVLLPSGKVLIASGSSWRNLGPVQFYPQTDDPAPAKGAFNRYEDPFRNDKLGEYYRVVNHTAIFDPDKNTFFRIPSPRPEPDPNVANSFAPNDFFCTGHLHLPDGNVLFAGGTEYYYPYRTGFRSTFLFDWRKEMSVDWSKVDWSQLPSPEADPWIFAGFMKRGRWYPHMVPLLDGRLALFGGFVGFDYDAPIPYQFEINSHIELFDPFRFDPSAPAAAWKSIDVKNLRDSPFATALTEPHPLPSCDVLCEKLEGVDRQQLDQCIERCRQDMTLDTFKLYPNNYLLADGRIYLTREGEWVSARTDDTSFMRRTKFTYFVRLGGTRDRPTADFSRGVDRPEVITSYGTSFLDPNNDTIAIVGGQPISEGSLLPPGSPAPNHFAGGRGSRKLETFRLPASPRDLGSWKVDDPDFLGTEPRDDRTMHYAVLLPTRQVLIINGGNYDFYGPIQYPVLLTPVVDRGTLRGYKTQRMAAALQPRLYHNTALLLPDARVLVLGGNTARATFRLDGPATVENPDNPDHPHPNLDLVDLDMYFFRDGQMAKGEKGMLTVPTETWVAEIFSPPYLSIDGDRRPAIDRIRPWESVPGDAPDARRSHSEDGEIHDRLASNRTYDATLRGLPSSCSGEGESLVLVKLASATHGWDSGQRLISLDTEVANENPRVIRFTMPDRIRDNIPPAFYMMFYVDCRGKPSRARFVLFDGAP